MDQLLPGLLRSGEAARRQAVHRLQFRRPPVHARLDVPLERADARHLLRQPQPLLALAQCLFGPLAPRYIAIDFEDRDGLVGLVPKQHVAAFHNQAAPILGRVFQFALPSRISLEDRLDLRRQSAFGLNEAVYKLPAGLRGAPAVHSLRPGIPAGDSPLRVGDDDGVVRGIDQERLRPNQLGGRFGANSLRLFGIESRHQHRRNQQINHRPRRHMPETRQERGHEE